MNLFKKTIVAMDTLQNVYAEYIFLIVAIIIAIIARLQLVNMVFLIYEWFNRL